MVKSALEELGATAITTDANARFYRYKNDVLLVQSPADVNDLYDQLYCIRFGMRIGRIDGGNFVPGHFLGANFRLENIPHLELE